MDAIIVMDAIFLNKRNESWILVPCEFKRVIYADWQWLIYPLCFFIFVIKASLIYLPRIRLSFEQFRKQPNDAGFSSIISAGNGTIAF
jgi:hypothetical protein